MSSRLFLSRPRGARPRLRRRRPGSSSTPTPARSRSPPASIRPGCRRRSRRSSPSSPACATSRSRPPSSTRRRRYLAGGLELRMEETRHVASWIGGQEALHDRVLTPRRGAGRDRRGRRRRTSSAGRRSCSATSACGWPAVAPARHLRGLERAPRACRHDREPVRAPAHGRPRPPPRGVATGDAGPGPRSTCGSASLALARAELEILAGAAPLDAAGLVDLAEARWRTGDLPAAGEAAAASPRPAARTRPIALRHRGRGGRRAGPAERGPPPGRPGAGAAPTADRRALRRHAALGRLAGRRRRAAADRRARSSTRSPARRPACAPATPTRPWSRRAAPDGRRSDGDAPARRPADARLLGRGPAPAPTGGRRAAGSGGGARCGRAALVAGAIDEAALRLALVLRLAPALAPAVLDATDGRRARPSASSAAMPTGWSGSRPSAAAAVRGRAPGRAPRPRRARTAPAEPDRRSDAAGRLPRASPAGPLADAEPHAGRRLTRARSDTIPQPSSPRTQGRHAVTERTLVLDQARRRPAPAGRPDPRPLRGARAQDRRAQARPGRSRASPSATTPPIARSRSSAGWSTSSPRRRSSRSPSRARTRSPSSARSTGRRARTRRRRARSAATSRSRPPRTSSTPRTAPRRPPTELALWFEPGELLEYERDIDRWVLAPDD